MLQHLHRVRCAPFPDKPCCINIHAGGGTPSQGVLGKVKDVNIWRTGFLSLVGCSHLAMTQFSLQCAKPQNKTLLGGAGKKSFVRFRGSRSRKTAGSILLRP